MPSRLAKLTPLLLAAGLLTAAAPAAALAEDGVHEHVRAERLPTGGTALLVQHIDTPSFGQSAAAYRGADRREGALTDRSLRTTAHEAPLAAAADAAPDSAATGSAPTPSTTWCGTERATDDTADQRTTLPRYKVIYARPKGLTDAFSTYANLMQQAPTWAANSIAASASNLRAPRFDYGTSCGAQYVDIASIVLPRTAATYQAMTIDQRASALMSDLQGALPSIGLSSASPWNYLVFADHVSPANDPRSVGYLRSDDTPGPGNANALGGLAAFIMGAGGSDFMGGAGQDYLAYSVTHELGHTLGAVQDGAPHSTGAGHCTDGLAIMCYDDGGPTAAGYTTSACSGPMGSYAASYTGIAFDCGSDDYISAAPPVGSWLSTHWNIFDSPFMCDTNSCTASTIAPTASLTATPTGATSGATVRLDASASRDSDGTIVDYRFDLDGDGTYETDTGTVPTATFTRSSPGTATVGVQVTDNDGLTGTATTSVTFTAPPAPAPQDPGPAQPATQDPAPVAPSPQDPAPAPQDPTTVPAPQPPATTTVVVARPRVTRVSTTRRGRIAVALRCPAGTRACRGVIDVAVRAAAPGGHSTIAVGRRRIAYDLRAGQLRTVSFTAPHARRGLRAQVSLLVADESVWRRSVTLR